ncbi:shikimate dehydrogenase [Blastococcus sp. Marseille-P5729]|uniref:shikimate dehydrogenase n=1 Tax=Blastococcus sp. Marseille-P5729 TaxID=2086582 RepID=UPI000D108EB7|nr:shikimate dehydrogenase [Blastococcus sp. Marseille-P5729]
MSTRRACAVIGSPIDHSRSPALHTAAYAELGLDWRYGRHDVPAGALAEFVDRVAVTGLDGLPCGGLSVTMPGKSEALARADHRDPRAVVLGAANTLVPRYDGAQLTGWSAYNTDVDGIIGAYADHGLRATAGRHAVVIGAGGTAAAALAALQALGCEEVDVVARNPARASTLVAAGEQLEVVVRVRSWSAIVECAERAEVLISTVPPGVADQVAGARFRSDQLVLDAVYAGGSTALLDAVAAGGGTAIGGVWMLLHQAVEQVRLMTGRRPSVEVMRAALR